MPRASDNARGLPRNAGQAAASANCINAEKADAETETAKRGHLQLDVGEFAKELKGSK